MKHKIPPKPKKYKINQKPTNSQDAAKSLLNNYSCSLNRTKPLPTKCDNTLPNDKCSIGQISETLDFGDDRKFSISGKSVIFIGFVFIKCVELFS